MTQVISFNSSKEEVAIYFQKEFKISEEVKNKLISEDISGDILLDITAQEYKSFGIKSGSWVKIKNFLSKYEEKLKQKNEITEKITIKSNAEEVKSFLERCLNFKEETNNLDGKDLIELDEEGMNKLGLNFGQKLKLGKYIKYFKTLKVEEEPLNEDIILDENSSDEDVQKFLLIKCKIPKTITENLEIDAQSLFLFEDNDIDDLTELNQEQKELLKNCLKELKNKTINKNSTKEEVAKFLKTELNFSDEVIKYLDLNGKSLFSLKDEAIDEFSKINEEEKIKLKNAIKKLKQEKEPEKEPEKDECISICHDYIREIYDKSSVSMREIRRFGIFFEYFIKYFKGKGYDRMKWSLNMTIYLCYYLRINDKNCRKELVNKLNKFYKISFLKVPEYETRKITREMIIEEGKGIALNRALRENLFTTFVCIENTVPIIIIGKPGTGKSLSFQILFNTLKGENSESAMFRNMGKLYRYYYQGSETSTAEGIEQVFAKALNAKKKDPNSLNINLVFFDEMGLAERSINNPLKVIHFLLEKDEKDSVPFLGKSNWRLDAAKINRALNLSITDYDPKDLEETGISIAEALDLDLSNKYKDFFETLSKTYYEYILFNQNTIKENKDFRGNRDFYNLIKTAMRELINKKEELNKNENKTLTETGLLSLSRNFGGLENSNSIVRDIFKKLYADKFDETIEISKGFSVLDAIKKNVSDRNSRYLMFISEGSDSSDIMKHTLESSGKKYIELVGTKHTKDSGRHSEEILNKTKYIMETDNILILQNLDMIYPALYDLFNQNYTFMSDKRYARIVFENAKISSEVNKDFPVVDIVNNDQVQNLKLDPPFLNRFEKHTVNFNMLLEDKDIAIAKNISEYFNLISTFNKNQKLKVDLEKLLINSKKHNIEGLIFKIKNDLLDKNGREERNNNGEENWINKEGPYYEENMNKEILKKIVPTFCQDIIASILILEKKLKKYDKLKKIILDIYKNSNHSNFEKIRKKKKCYLYFQQSSRKFIRKRERNRK